jgi:outer membrane protein OmpU
MNKLTKIGASALCGSLACVAANAGTMAVSGSAVATYTTQDKAVTGNPIGMNSGMTFTGSGELDNGTTFAVSITHANQNAYSSGNIVLTVPGLGKIGIDQGAGGQGIDAIDDMMPTAWEETNGTGLTTSLRTVSGVGGSSNIQWTADEAMTPDGLSLAVAYTPRAGKGQTNDKAQGGAGNNYQGSGYDAVVQYSGYEGMNLFAGYSKISQETVAATRSGDASSWAAGFTYAFSGITVGFEKSKEKLENAATSAVSYYENNLYGVSYLVNDNLSLSYGKAASEAVKNGAANVENTADSVQISYTMGGATVVVAQTSVDNGSYTSGTSKDLDGRTIRLKKDKYDGEN